MEMRALWTFHGGGARMVKGSSVCVSVCRERERGREKARALDPRGVWQEKPTR